MPQDAEEQELDDQPHDPDTRSQPWSPLWGSGLGQSSGLITTNSIWYEYSDLQSEVR